MSWFGTDFYRPQRSCEGYVFTGVCLSTPDQVHPSRGADTPPGTRCTPLPGTRYIPPRDTVTAADGTHPTGMHSCALKKVDFTSLNSLLRIKPNRK